MNLYEIYLLSGFFIVGLLLVAYAVVGFLTLCMLTRVAPYVTTFSPKQPKNKLFMDGAGGGT